MAHNRKQEGTRPPTFYYSEAFKRMVVEEVERGRLPKDAADAQIERPI